MLSIVLFKLNSIYNNNNNYNNTSSRIFENSPQKGPECLHKNLAIAGFW